jgi:hypothetical protein
MVVRLSLPSVDRLNLNGWTWNLIRFAHGIAIKPNQKAARRAAFYYLTYLVGDEGLEPPTSSLSVTRSNQLS